MIISVIGAGLMGPAGAFNALKDPDVTRVRLIDNNADRLTRAADQLRRLDPEGKLEPIVVDLNDRDLAVDALRGSDAAMAALPWSASRIAFERAMEAGVPIVDLAIPEESEFPELRVLAESQQKLILLGCGLEPGLTEIMARYLATRLDAVDELHIKVGGIPEEPVGPLGYRIVFGGESLPLRDIEALVIVEGEGRMEQRYGGLESTTFEGVGEVEAWHEGVLRWMLDLPELQGIRHVTQKTLRWPGYAAKARMLNELGLLGTEAVDVAGTQVIPKQLVDTILRPHVTLREEEGDITLYRVDMIGRRGGGRVQIRAEMVDRMDRDRRFTSMARTTAFTGMIATRMIARGDIEASGLYTAEQVITPELFERMMAELAAEGIDFTIVEEGLA